MAKRQNKALALPNVELGANYLELKANLNDKQLKDVFGALQAMKGATLWWIGDFLLSQEARKGENYARAYTFTDYEPNTLWQAKSICKKLPRELRVNLSFSHHKEALTETNQNVELAVQFLRQLEPQRPTVKQLRAHIGTALATRLPNKETDSLRKDYKDLEMLLVEDAFNTLQRFLENTTSQTFALKKQYVRSRLQSLSELANVVCN